MYFSDNEISTIITVAECHSVTQAATMLYTSRQNVSKTIAKIEKKLDTVLFQRTHDGVYLTAAGQIVYQYAVEMEKMQSDLISRLHPDIAAEISGNIQVVTIPHLLTPIASILTSFNSTYPDVNINVSEMDPRLLSDSLLQGNKLNGDIFFFARNVDDLNQALSANNPFRFFLLKKNPIVLYANKNSQIADLKYISIAALKNLDMAVYSPSSSQSFIAFERDPYLKDLKANVKFHSNNLDICKNYVLSNRAHLLGNYDTYDFAADTEKIVKIPFKENVCSYTYMAVFNKEQPPVMKKLIESILSNYDYKNISF